MNAMLIELVYDEPCLVDLMWKTMEGFVMEESKLSKNDVNLLLCSGLLQILWLVASFSA
jgi:hypothetical protein